MIQPHRQATIRGPTFIRLLARLCDMDVRASGESLSDRLSSWLDWKQSLVLSSALDDEPPPVDDDGPAFDSAEEAECARMRATLAESMVQAAALQRGNAKAFAADDYTPFRQHYLGRQRAMQAATGALRGRLRDMLARRSGDMARLAEVDAAMERALSPREQSLLARVPRLLGDHFDRLCRASRQASNHPPGADDAWRGIFRNDMRSVLLAELDVRFQPVEALLAALRTHQQENHVQTPS